MVLRPPLDTNEVRVYRHPPMIALAEKTTAAVVRGVDELFTKVALVSPRREHYDPDTRIAETRRFLESLPADLGRDTERFFPVVGADGWSRRTRRTIEGGHVVDLRTRSAHELLFADASAAFAAMTSNDPARARHFRHRDRGRPAVIFVHGFMAGGFAMEEHDWPTRSFYRAGLDVVLAQLPGHGARKGNRVWDPPEWPGKSPTFTIEGYRQAIGELRGLVGHLLADGITDVAVVGMSLGGYTSALLSTVETRLALVAPFIPLASTADFLRDNGQIRGDAEQVAIQRELIERIFWCVSPLARPCLVPSAGRLVFAGTHDRVTPIAHADRIAAHFGVETTTFPGGHLLQFGRARVWQALLANLRNRGILRARAR